MCRYWTDCSPATALAPLTAALELTYVAGPDPADRAVVDRRRFPRKLHSAGRCRVRWLARRAPPPRPASAVPRQANAALYRITLSRLRWDAQTGDYLARRIAEGKSRREVIRCLKRYIAREIYQIISEPRPDATTQCAAA